MAVSSELVKVQNTHNVDAIASAVLDLFGMLNSPQRDDVLLGEAGVSIDRALFPLLVRLGNGRASVAELADKVGRDYTTVSRQLAKLEELNLIARADGEGDRRRREAILSVDGKKMVRAISAARRRLLSKVLEPWSESDKSALARFMRRFADDMISAR
jgi:DNA-binding MarR family transcriptional regulator